MRVAVPANGKIVASHFGHCPFFAIFNIENEMIVDKTTIEAPSNHQPGVLPQLLKDHGVNLIIADGLGQKAVQLFESWGIRVIVGVNGVIEDVINKFINGELKAGDNNCSH